MIASHSDTDWFDYGPTPRSLYLLLATPRRHHGRASVQGLPSQLSERLLEDKYGHRVAASHHLLLRMPPEMFALFLGVFIAGPGAFLFLTLRCIMEEGFSL